MKNKIYPAVFHAEEDGYCVSFPDLAGCVTNGQTLEEAFTMAKEALALFIDDMENLPMPSKMQDIQVGVGEMVMLVEADDADDIVYIKKSEVAQAERYIFVMIINWKRIGR